MCGESFLLLLHDESDISVHVDGGASAHPNLRIYTCVDMYACAVTFESRLENFLHSLNVSRLSRPFWWQIYSDHANTQH